MAQKGIYQRGEVYWIRYTGSDGRQVRESSRSTKQKDALDLLRLRQAAVLKGDETDIVKIKNHTFAELADRYLEFCVNQRDIINKKGIVGMLKAEFGNLPLKSFTVHLVERYQSKIVATIKNGKSGQPVSPSTANRKIATLKHMFTKAADWYMVSDTVSKLVHKVKLYKVDNARVRFLSDDEIKELLAACDHARVKRDGTTEQKKQGHLRPVVLFALNTGCRRQEILSLKWEQVDLVHGFINLTRTKNGEKRQLPINDVLREVLSKQIRRIDVPYVFYDSQTGKRFTNIKRSFATACKKAGIVDFHFHDLRHTFASHLVMKGVDLTTVSRLLGHKSLTMTLRYAHLAPNHLINAVNVLNCQGGRDLTVDGY
jgi:integrase